MWMSKINVERIIYLLTGVKGKILEVDRMFWIELIVKGEIKRLKLFMGYR